MPDRFEGKVVVITGAAGGIGRATAVRFASEGARILAVDLPDSELDETVAAVHRAGGEIATHPADVTVASEVDGYVQAALDQFGQIDVFFNNAGIEGWVGPLPGLPGSRIRSGLRCQRQGRLFRLAGCGTSDAGSGRGRDRQHGLGRGAASQFPSGGIRGHQECCRELDEVCGHCPGRRRHPRQRRLSRSH